MDSHSNSNEVKTESRRRGEHHVIVVTPATRIITTHTLIRDHPDADDGNCGMTQHEVGCRATTVLETSKNIQDVNDDMIGTGRGMKRQALCW